MHINGTKWPRNVCPMEELMIHYWDSMKETWKFLNIQLTRKSKKKCLNITKVERIFLKKKLDGYIMVRFLY